jgi:hypothetical protein
MTIVQGPWVGPGPLRGRPPERRLHQRLRVLLRGHLFAPDRTSAACTIHDLSEAGARLTVEAGAVTPSTFHLMTPKTRSGHAAQVVWRRNGSVGVVFTRSYELDDPDLEFEVRSAWRALNAG